MLIMLLVRNPAFLSRFLYYLHNFLSLQSGMRNILTKISVVLLTVWYCLSIIGFDVHTCARTGDSFVHVSLTSHSCHDIHDDHCDSSCMHECDGHCDGHEEHHHDDDCCDDEYQVISLTGLRSGDDDRDIFSSSESPCLMAAECCTFTLSAGISRHIYTCKPDSGLIVPDSQAILGIWRI